jgi:hypothetical protein
MNDERSDTRVGTSSREARRGGPSVARRVTKPCWRECLHHGSDATSGSLAVEGALGATPDNGMNPEPGEE